MLEFTPTFIYNRAIYTTGLRSNEPTYQAERDRKGIMIEKSNEPGETPAGGIHADEIKARNLVSGLQYIADPAQASVEDLRRELAALRTQLEQAIAAQEIPDAADADDARESLATAETELAKPQPAKNRVLRKLDELSQIITRSAETADAAGKLGALVIRLAPIAATIWQVAQHLLGG